MGESGHVLLRVLKIHACVSVNSLVFVLVVTLVLVKCLEVFYTPFSVTFLNVFMWFLTVQWYIGMA